MTKLHQVLALEKGRKSEAKSRGDAVYQRIQKAQLADGGYGNYEPATEEDVALPAERHVVQNQVASLLRDYAASQIPAWDITATKDAANMTATATVSIAGDGRKDGSGLVLADLPVTTLLFLEKQLTDLRTVISRSPVLDPGESWEFNRESGLHETPPVATVRTKKVVRHTVVVPPTDRHPAQVSEYADDVPAGTWTRVKQSGALPATRREELLRRVGQLLEAVKSAREQANEAEVSPQSVGQAVFDWVLRD